MSAVLTALGTWSPWRWRMAALIGTGVALAVAIPTAVMPNPIFGRAVEVTWWSYPTVLLTGMGAGELVRVRDQVDHREPGERHPPPGPRDEVPQRNDDG